jgi:polyhydroxyalkanoate synthase subunit PhaE
MADVDAFSGASQRALLAWMRCMSPWVGAENGWGAWLNSPSLGAGRERNERMNGVTLAWLELTRARAEYSAVMFTAWHAVAEASMRELVSRSRQQQLPPDLRSFTSLFVKLADGILAQTFASSSYLEVQRQLLQAEAAYRRREAELVDDVATGGHFATRRQLDELHREIYELRRELRGLRKMQATPMLADQTA